MNFFPRWSKTFSCSISLKNQVGKSRRVLITLEKSKQINFHGRIEYFLTKICQNNENKLKNIHKNCEEILTIVCIQNLFWKEFKIKTSVKLFLVIFLILPQFLEINPLEETFYFASFSVSFSRQHLNNYSRFANAN